jgi:hypothetical protein
MVWQEVAGLEWGGESPRNEVNYQIFLPVQKQEYFYSSFAESSSRDLNLDANVFGLEELMNSIEATFAAKS